MKTLTWIIAFIGLFVSAFALTEITYAIFDLDKGIVSWIWGMCTIPVLRIIVKFTYDFVKEVL